MESDYYHKYPFGTVHYLIALMAKEGMQVDLPDLNKIYQISIAGGHVKYKTCAGHIILRADDALYSTLSPYRANALDWWNWLDPGHNSIAIDALREFIKGCQSDKAKEYKEDVGKFFRALGCDGNDGAFQYVTDSDGHILSKVIGYRNVICSIVGMSLELPTDYVIHKGKYDIQFSRPGQDMDILHASNLYSYAFIFGPKPKHPNFSFTIDME